MSFIRWKYDIIKLDILLGYTSVLIIGQAIGFFSIMSKMNLQRINWIKFAMLKIDECSFGIYLIHMVFVRIVFLYINPYKTNAFLAFLVIVLTITVLSYMVTWVLKKVPVLKNIF